MIENDVFEEENKDSIYSEEVVENLLDDDSITPVEAGFMQGYMEA